MPIHPISANFKEERIFIKKTKIKKIKDKPKFSEMKLKIMYFFHTWIPQSLRNWINFFLHLFKGSFSLLHFFLFRQFMVFRTNSFLGGLIILADTIKFKFIFQTYCLLLYMWNISRNHDYTYLCTCHHAFLMMSFVENSGYLSRAAFKMIGDGKRVWMA